MPSGKQAKNVGDILPKVIKNLGIEDRMQEARLREEWREIVGDVVAERCRPGEIKGGMLFIEVENNVWMQEIRFHQRDMIVRIKKRFPDLGVREIRLVIGRERSEE